MPVSMADLLGYLADEAPGGEQLTSDDLEFQRTADVEGTRYWIWKFAEPDGGDPAFLTVSHDGTSDCVGYEADDYSLTPEQFILGDYHQVF